MIWSIFKTICAFTETLNASRVGIYNMNIRATIIIKYIVGLIM